MCRYGNFLSLVNCGMGCVSVPIAFTNVDVFVSFCLCSVNQGNVGDLKTLKKGLSLYHSESQLSALSKQQDALQNVRTDFFFFPLAFPTSSAFKPFFKIRCIFNLRNGAPLSGIPVAL